MSFDPDPKTWGLSAGGIKYRLMNGYPKGSIDEETGQIEEKYIIHSSDLVKFLGLSFPLGIDLDEETYIISPNRRFPGAPAFATTTVSFEPFEDSLPADPYNIDPDAPDATYGKFMFVTISYVTGKQQEDENNAITLLEVSADSTAEFLTVPVRGKSTWGDSSSPSKREEVKGALTNVTKLIPETQWDVTWPQVQRSFLPTIIGALRNRIGQVNSKKMSMLHNAVKETVMLVGFSYREDFTWRDGLVNTPATITMKFLEKHTKQGKVVIGHNHFIQDESGKFMKLWNPYGSPIYALTDLNNLFPPNIKVTD